MRRQVGAVVVKEKHILATGYNGTPTGIRHCEETGCLREQLNVPSGERHELCRGLHAEQNAIIQSARHGINITDSTIYCTNSPCIICTKMLINAGIREVVYLDGYPDTLSMDMLKEAGIDVHVYADLVGGEQ
jgi:dCMP deaminase